MWLANFICFKKIVNDFCISTIFSLTEKEKHYFHQDKESPKKLKTQTGKEWKINKNPHILTKLWGNGDHPCTGRNAKRHAHIVRIWVWGLSCLLLVGMPLEPILYTFKTHPQFYYFNIIIPIIRIIDNKLLSTPNLQIKWN
jgi:hypothetical protein